MWSKTVVRAALGVGLCAAFIVGAWSDETTSSSSGTNGPIAPGVDNAFGLLWESPWFLNDKFEVCVNEDGFTQGPIHWVDEPVIVLTSYTESGPVALVTEGWKPPMSDKRYDTLLWPPHAITMLVVNATASVQSIAIGFGGLAADPPPPPPEAPPEEPVPPPG
jgi:hypothetical protein